MLDFKEFVSMGGTDNLVRFEHVLEYYKESFHV